MWFLLFVVFNTHQGPQMLFKGPFLTEIECLEELKSLSDRRTRPAEQKFVCIRETSRPAGA